MVYKIECGQGYKGPTVRNNGEYLPFVMAPTESLPIRAKIDNFHPLKAIVGSRERYVLAVRIHAKEGYVILEETGGTVIPAPMLKIFDGQLINMEGGGLKVVVFDPTAKTQDICLIKP